jgi:hypothetical protein
VPTGKNNGRLPIEASSSQKQAVQAIILIAAVVLFNLALCVSIFLLAKRDYVGGIFPALVLFLSFALSVGVILITFLGESVNKTNIENEWVRKIGVTPIMTIAAVLISLLAGFSPLAKLIVPPPVETPDPYSGHFMLAKVGVTCSAQKLKGVDLPQATALLVVITSSQKDYIPKIKELLHQPESLKSLMRTKNELKFQIVSADPKDESYQLLTKYGTDSSESLTNDMSQEDNWVAYTVPVRAPTIDTTVPVPTIFDDYHKTRLFVITKQWAPNDQQPELTSLTAASAGSGSAKLKLSPLFEAAITPRTPEKESFLTELGFRVFSESACWHATL